MSTYISRYDHFVVKVSENTYRSVGEMKETHSITNTGDDDIFRIGDQVDIESFNGHISHAEVLGFVDNAILLNVYGDLMLHSRVPYEQGLVFTVNPDVTELPVCFTRGTLIDTPDGAVPIENLKIGDRVYCSTGWRQVKWIGWRGYSLQSPGMSEELRKNSAPIRIKLGAIEDNVPNKDLIVSPWHHIYLNNVLVRANDIVNGVTIVQEMDAEQVQYFHIELDEFDVILAHGVYSESWADGGNRDFFENVNVTALHPRDMKRRRANRPGFTVVREGPVLEQIKTKLLERANWIQTPEMAKLSA